VLATAIKLKDVFMANPTKEIRLSNRNIDVLTAQSGRSLYATESGKIKSNSKWNIIGRFIHWCQDPKGERLHKAVDDVVSNLELRGGDKRPYREMLIKLIDDHQISEIFRERVNGL
jgi:hypothetical protein